MRVEVAAPRLMEPGGPPRSEGLHISSVLRLIAVENGALDKKWVDDLDLVEVSTPGWWDSLDPASQIRMAIGMAWEEWYVRTQLPEVVHQPGELSLQGVYMTPDGESLEVLVSEFNQYGLRLHEVKTTSKSLNNVIDIRNQFLWLTQIKCYCKAMGTRFATLHVLFLFGDYSRPYQQMIRVFNLEFSQLELDDNWEMVQTFIQHKRQQQAEDLMRDTEKA